jgi:hypothetical protein
MKPIRLHGTVTADHTLTIHVPDDIPPGEVVVTIAPKQSLTREEARQILDRVRMLADFNEPYDQTLMNMTQEEIWDLGRPLRPTRPAHEEIDEDRNER